MRQEDIIFQHLTEHGSITPFEAFADYHITRLAAVVFRLRREHDIETVILHGYDTNGDHIQYARYTLKEPPPAATGDDSKGKVINTSDLPSDNNTTV